MGARGFIARFVFASAALLVAPAVAQAETFCVNAPGCMPAQNYNANQLQTALDAAAALAGADRIVVGPGLYDDGPYAAGAGNPIELIGSGAGQTTLRRSGNADNQTVLTLAHVASSVDGLTIDLTGAGNNLTGLSTAAVANRIAVTETTAAGTPRTGILFTSGSGVLTQSAVTLSPNTASTTTAVSAPLLQNGPQLTLQRNELTAATGVSYSTPLRVDRNRITARSFGIGGAGPLVVDHASIRLLGGGGVNAAAISVGSASANGNHLSPSLDARHVTAAGPGAGSGILFGAGCSNPPPANVSPLGGSATIRSTILRSFTNDLRRFGTTCFDPISNTTQNSSATLSIVYSVFDPATVTSNGAGTLNQGAGNRNVDPLFVDAAGGNLRLQQGSAAIDAGDPAPASGGETDLDGNARVQDGNGDGTAVRDIGAFEHTFVPPPADGGGGGDGGGDGGGGGGDGGGGGGATEITRTLSLGYSDKSDKFKGALKSNEQACLAGKVKVFEKAKGKDPKVGSDETDDSGKWAFKEKGADGKFYGSVPEKTVPAGTCPAAKSKAKKVD